MDKRKRIKDIQENVSLHQKRPILSMDPADALETLLYASKQEIEPPQDFAKQVLNKIQTEHIQVEPMRAASPARTLTWMSWNQAWVRGVVAVAAAGIVFMGIQSLDSVPDPGVEIAENDPPVLTDITEPDKPNETPAQTEGAVIVNPDGPDSVGEENPPLDSLPDESSGEEATPDDASPIRDIDDILLNENIPLDAVVSIASAKAQLPVGTLALTTLYLGEDKALAPSIQEDGSILYFIQDEDGRYSLVRQDLDETSYSIVAESVSSDEIGIQAAMTRPISKKDISISNDAVYYKEIEILPSLMDATLQYALAPNGIYVAVNARSDIPAIEGLWVTDIYNANMGRLSAFGGGRILAWAPDSMTFLFTDREGSVYLADLDELRTYLVVEQADKEGDVVANYSVDSKRFVLAASAGTSSAVYYVQTP